MRGAFGDAPSSGDPTNHEVLDRKTAYAWVITPPAKGEYLHLAGEELHELPSVEKKRTAAYGKPKKPRTVTKRAPSLNPEQVIALREERDRTRLSFVVLGRKYGVSETVAMRAYQGTGAYAGIGDPEFVPTMRNGRPLGSDSMPKAARDKCARLLVIPDMEWKLAELAEVCGITYEQVRTVQRQLKALAA